MAYNLPGTTTYLVLKPGRFSDPCTFMHFIWKNQGILVSTHVKMFLNFVTMNSKILFF